MSLLGELSALCGDAFASLGLDRQFGQVVVSQRPEFGHFQCNGALAGGRAANRDPRALAAEVTRLVIEDPRIATAEVAGPGFVNLTVTDEHLARELERIATDSRFGVEQAGSALDVVVDYSGPNVAKAMHAGHLRATIIGDCIARMLSFAGHHVTRDPHFGDWGYQMGLLLAALEERMPELPYFDEDRDEFPDISPVTLDDLQEIYPEASSKAETDPEFAERARKATVELQQGRPGYRALWRHMKAVSEASQREDFADLGVEFDLWYGESDVHDRIEPMIERLESEGVAIESEGALIVPVSEEGESRELPPLILRSSAGGFLYSTTDLATIEMRVRDLGAQLILYVVDARQSDHFEQLFRAARLGGIAPSSVRLEHIRFGTMNGPDRKPFKTRAGGIVRLGDLIEMVRTAAAKRLAEADLASEYPPDEREDIVRKVGIAALKFGDLINNRASDYLFDLNRFSSFEGKTGPYLQYAAVRIGSILRNAADARVMSGRPLPPGVPVERDLILELLRFPDVVDRAIELRAPNHVAEYAYELAGAFNRFYEECHILGETDAARQASWLTLATVTRNVLVTALGLLGIEVPERM